MTDATERGASLRAGAQGGHGERTTANGTKEAGVRSLVERLSAADGPVRFDTVDEPLTSIRRRIEELRHIALTFTATEGGTTLAVTIDPETTSLAGADFEAGTGSARLAGTLVLDYVPVRCVATIDLATRTGTGRLLPR